MAKTGAVMETHAINSDLDTGSCGRCEQCRCGENRKEEAAPPEIGAELRAVHATVSLVSITATHAVSGAESRPDPDAGVDL